jgi:hypothetical protein
VLLDKEHAAASAVPELMGKVAAGCPVTARSLVVLPDVVPEPEPFGIGDNAWSSPAGRPEHDAYRSVLDQAANGTEIETPLPETPYAAVVIDDLRRARPVRIHRKLLHTTILTETRRQVTPFQQPRTAQEPRAKLSTSSCRSPGRTTS